jgi:5-methylcytosine-specific restriction endonuclease McrA
MTTETVLAADRPRPWIPRTRPRLGLLNKNRKRRRAFLHAWGGRCVYCAKPLKAEADNSQPVEVMTVEHIVPRVDGGGDIIANLCPACDRCNADRASHPLRPDFAARLLDRAAAVQAVLIGEAAA